MTIVQVVFRPQWTDEDECYRVEPGSYNGHTGKVCTVVDGTRLVAYKPQLSVAMGQPIVRVTDDEWEW